MARDKLAYDIVLNDPHNLSMILQFYEFVSRWLILCVDAAGKG